LSRWTTALQRWALLAAVSARAHWRYRRASKAVTNNTRSTPKPDIVYLWHNPADPEWVRRRNQTLELYRDDPSHARLPLIGPTLTLGELKYSLRSLERFFPDHGTIHMVVDRQLPAWLNAAHPDIHLVQHTEIFDDARFLPTFNSEAIESYLHRIEGLSEHFIYFNDDVLLRAPATVGDFFTTEGHPRYRLGRAVSSDGPMDAETDPVDAAHSNSNNALNHRYGTEHRLTLAHRALPLLKSSIAATEQAFPREFLSSRSNQFRSPRMHALLFRLVPFRAAYEGQAELVPPNLFEKDMHFWANDPDHNRSTAHAVDRGRGIGFCIQENHSVTLTAAAVDAFQEWMEQRYPAKSRFEID
jgi:stealth protein CR2